MGKQGELIPEHIREYIVGLKRREPGLSQRRLAELVAVKFERTVDKSSVGKILNDAGLGGRQAKALAGQPNEGNYEPQPAAAAEAPRAKAPRLTVRVDTGSEGFFVRPNHAGGGALDPINVYFTVRNLGEKIVRSMEVNLWAPHPWAYRYPLDGNEEWVREDGVRPPKELAKYFQGLETRWLHRYVLRIIDRKDWFLMPRGQAAELPGIPLYFPVFPASLILPLVWEC